MTSEMNSSVWLLHCHWSKRKCYYILPFFIQNILATKQDDKTVSSSWTLFHFLHINMVLLPASGFSYALLLFISALSLIASARRQLVLFYKVLKKEEMLLSHVIVSWGAFISVTAFSIHGLQFHASASHPVINKFHRVLATIWRCWSSWIPLTFPTAQLWLRGWVCWMSVWMGWSHRVPVAESVPVTRNRCLKRCHGIELWIRITKFK